MTPEADISNVTVEQRAQIIREERDQLVLAWVRGQLNDMTGAEDFLNARIRKLGVETMTGDTTEGA
jgi:carbamoylphosphate synthase large subunit